MTYTRERFNAPSAPAGAGGLGAWIARQFQFIQRSMPWPIAADTRDFVTAGEGGDVTAQLANAISAAGAGNLFLHPRTYRVLSNLALSARTIPAQGALLRPNTGVTIRVSAPVDAGTSAWVDPTDGGAVYLVGGARRTITPQEFNAKGDVKSNGDPITGLVGTYSITSGSNVLTSTTPIFAATDGPQIVAYGAGPTVANFVQPLSTTYTYVNSQTIHLAANASHTVTNGLYTSGSAEGGTSVVGRIAWGTDDTAAIIAAITALAAWDGTTASNYGGTVLFLPGRYFINRVLMDRAIADATHNGFNHIYLKGSGRDSTALENFDPITSLVALVDAGPVSAACDAPSNTPGADWLRGFELSDLELRQIQNNTAASNILSLGAAYDPQIHHFNSYGWSYEGMALGGHGFKGKVHHGLISHAGRGGPANPPSTSALNLLAAEAIAEHIEIIGAGQAMEASARRGLIADCTLDGRSTPTWVSPRYGINIGSDGQGIWGLKVLRNRILGYDTAISVSNALGTMDRVNLDWNTITDGGFTFTSGLESNSVIGIDIETDAVIHGDSSMSHNGFLYTKAPAQAVFQFGPATGAVTTGCLEQVLIKANTIQVLGMYCSGGTRDGLLANVPADCTGGGQALSLTFITASNYGPPRWLPGQAYGVGQYVVPRASNERMYVCTVAGTSGNSLSEPAWPAGLNATVADNTVTWKCFGKESKIILDGNSVVSSGNTIDNPASMRFDLGTTRRSSIVVVSHTQNYDWSIAYGSASESFPGFLGETIPANAVYSDLNRFPTSNTTPTAGKYALRTIINKSDTTKSTCTRAGIAGAVWQATHAYQYGDVVVATVDNGHCFQCVLPTFGGGTANSAGAEPVWNTGTGATTVDAGVTWKELGVSCLFSAFV